MNGREFPLLLKLWVKVERILYRAPEVDPLVEHPMDSDFQVLYDGMPDIRYLWRSLLRRKTPHIQVFSRETQTGKKQLLAESYVAIPDKLFFCTSLRICLQRRTSLLARSRQRLHVEVPEVAEPTTSGHISEKTRLNTAILAFAIRHVIQKIVNQPSKLFLRNGHWMIAYRHSSKEVHPVPSPDSDSSRFAEWSTLNCPKDRFFADPFPWVHTDGNLHLFFEEMPYSTNRGVISHVAFDKTTRTPSSIRTVVLERPYHLSYPFLFTYENHVFMIPETSENGTIELYRAIEFPTLWAFDTVLMSDVIAADTTLYHDGELWWLFTSIGDKSSPNWDELSLFNATTPFGKWTPHRLNPIVSDCRRGRMGGSIFRDAQQRLIRPAQDCEREYGGALRFYEITELSSSSYSERLVSIRHPFRGHHGLHTWNSAAEMSAIDMKTNLVKWRGPRAAARPDRKINAMRDLPGK
ncbi:glucosamine inositolphosphorylceramide transferase family protein [Paraburkholderia franconis]|uniref:glucosamine inositolphosphorylceramide transferase family protein n=1 Tax=Paraburkholderia franconis TaxID=2654983 RepID=UPI00187B35F9|nr:hypothetical protein [Paraburkholderia franconis]